MNINNLTLIFLITLFLSSCSLAPFSATSSGRSHGQGKMQAEIGNVNSSYNLKFGFGVAPDVDAGFLMEFGAISTSALFFKYSMLNNPTGPALALEFGYGSTETTKFYYGGLIGSIAFTEEFELFSSIRINSVSTDETDIEKDKLHGNIKIKSYDVNYIQFSYGMNIWFTENNGLNLYSVHFRGNDIETSQDSTFGAAFLFKY